MTVVVPVDRKELIPVTLFGTISYNKANVFQHLLSPSEVLALDKLPVNNKDKIQPLDLFWVYNLVYSTWGEWRKILKLKFKD